jgi:nucleotide-binding universal stress UspA family protein
LLRRKLAVALRAELDIFHVEPHNDQSDWHWAPSVLGTLKRWGTLPAGATDAEAAADTHTDLVVMATHGRAGRCARALARVARGHRARDHAAHRRAPAVVERIVVTTLDRDADLIVPVTEGRRGFLDAVRGSTVERLLEQRRIPLLVVPRQDWEGRP